MDYDTMLDKARERLPDSATQFERFEIPKASGHMEGNKTVIGNFKQVADALGRPVNQLQKYILRELATPGDLRGNALIMGTKISASRFNGKVRQFAHDFVICRECGKPDTTLSKDSNINTLKCQACGARQVVRARL
ncbi:hypothetical protein AUJ68_02800 [Candidatus Woesearchaeota archaeon CG1_02_57_44]|nr:MAG: hypothetical protein AUJ68_02800 [Candidatus Woesearchaeota archaeon CG1_02_57_44]PIN69462.1 MAG: translation initiation factor IF-2 subunit beta [Candidatus Woesearchaeota archaeon CG11_big_fil_rev_8_21_14_0_20_57_5]